MCITGQTTLGQIQHFGVYAAGGVGSPRGQAKHLGLPFKNSMTKKQQPIQDTVEALHLSRSFGFSSPLQTCLHHPLNPFPGLIPITLNKGRQNH